MRALAPLMFAIAACGGDEIEGTWTHVDELSRWRFCADGTYSKDNSVQPEGTWRRLDAEHLELSPDTLYTEPGTLEVAQDGDLLLADVKLFEGHLVPESGGLAGTSWARSLSDCCANGSPFTYGTLLQLREDGTLELQRSHNPFEVTHKWGTWTATDLGFRYVIPDDGSSVDMVVIGERASTFAYRRD